MYKHASAAEELASDESSIASLQSPLNQLSPMQPPLQAQSQPSSLSKQLPLQTQIQPSSLHSTSLSIKSFEQVPYNPGHQIPATLAQYLHLHSILKAVDLTGSSSNRSSSTGSQSSIDGRRSGERGVSIADLRSSIESCTSSGFGRV